MHRAAHSRVCDSFAFSISNPLRGCFSDLASTPTPPHSITPRGRIRGQPVRRSPWSMLPTAGSRPPKRGALHNRDVGEVGRTTRTRTKRLVSLRVTEPGSAYKRQMPLRANIAVCSGDYIDHAHLEARANVAPKKMNANPFVVLGGAAATICVVDDDPSMLKALERLLLSVGWCARFFREPLHFLKYATLNPVRVALIDIWLPGMSGLELQKQARRRFSGDARHYRYGGRRGIRTKRG